MLHLEGHDPLVVHATMHLLNILFLCGYLTSSGMIVDHVKVVFFDCRFTRLGDPLVFSLSLMNEAMVHPL